MDPLQRAPSNQATPLVGYNVATADHALMDAVAAFGGDHSAEIVDALTPLGSLAGSAEAREHWHLANENEPVLRTADRYGNRIDEVEFHPSWHWLMTQGVGFGLTAEPWVSQSPVAHLKRAAGFFAWGQTEQGHMCPITMTYAVVPALRADDALAKQWTTGLASRTYDFGLRPPEQKAGLLAGMGMTEKQGGSDLRTNTTIARPTETHGEYLITGHKWFTSAPMNDVFLVLAQAPEGMTCFVVPRVRPDGSRNALSIVRLKDKLGNRSNASSELEFNDAHAVRLGDEGRGIRTIIEMVSATRMDCILGSAGIMRKALAEAAWHTSHRAAFGATLADQPAMTNVLADLAVESEAATWSRCGWPVRSTTSTTRTSRRCAASASRSRSSGSASGRRSWSPRRSSASAATGMSRSPACRCCSASRRSTRSGRAAATSTPSTSCAHSVVSPRASTPGSPRSARCAARMPGSTPSSTRS